MARPRKVVEGVRQVIPFGSPEHSALLGLNARGLAPQRKADLEEALNVSPSTIPTATEKDIPWASRKGERLPGGWVRKGY